MVQPAIAQDIYQPLTKQVQGRNQLAYDPASQRLAFSDVRMNVGIAQGDEILFALNLGSQSEKVRPTDRVRGLAFSTDGTKLFVAAADQVYALNSTTGDILWTYRASRNFGFLIVSPMTLDARHGRVVAAFDNGSLAAWDENGRLLSIWHDNDSPRHLSLSASGTVVGTDSFSICSWNVETRQKEIRIPMPSRAFGFAAAPSGQLAAVRTLHEVALWNLAERRAVASVKAEPGLPVLSFHPNGEEVAVGTRTGIQVLGRDGHISAFHDTQGRVVLSVAFSPDGTKLAAGLSNDEMIELRLPD